MKNTEYRSILVTGASGFVGRRLMKALAKSYPDAQITGVGGPARAHDRNLGIDLTDRFATAALITKISPDVVFHLAAQSSVGSSNIRPTEVWRSNFEGTVNLADLLADQEKPSLLIFASTSEVYGETFREGPCTEQSPVAPVSSYGRSKIAAEYYLKDLARGHMHIVCLRLFNHIGPGQDSRFVVSSFAEQIAQIESRTGTGIISVGNLGAFRDFTSVDDIIRAYLLLLKDTSLAQYDVYNVGSGHLVSIKQILEDLIGLSKASVNIERDPTRFRPIDIERAEGVFQKFGDKFDWAPQIPLRDTLRLMLDHARAKVSAQSST